MPGKVSPGDAQLLIQTRVNKMYANQARIHLYQQLEQNIRAAGGQRWPSVFAHSNSISNNEGLRSRPGPCGLRCSE